jgi:tRNA uridine 5-carbamoylmethylation protein Kti12
MKCIILSGIPGSGKTWQAEKLADFVRARRGGGAAFIACADNHVDYKRGHLDHQIPAAHIKCWRSALEFLQEASPDEENDVLIVANTNLTAWEIQSYHQMAVAFGAAVKVVRVHCESAVAYARQGHEVPFDRHKEMCGRFEARDVLPWWEIVEFSADGTAGCCGEITEVL